MATFSLTIAAPARDVFDYLSDPRRRPEWQASLRAVEPVDHASIGVGTRWVDHTVVGARPRLRIVEMRAPDGTGRPGVWGEVGEWRGLRADLTLRFQDAGPDRTLLTWSLALHGSAGWRPLRLVLQALAPGAVRSDLRRAARILESG